MTLPKSPRQVRNWLKNDWVKEYRELLDLPSDPNNEISTTGFTCKFDAVVDYFKCFHCMKPVGDLDLPDVAAAVKNLLRMLADAGLEPIEFDDLVKIPENRSLMTCDCPVYMHYGWCHHSCSVAFDRGIISSYPIRMDPTGLMKVKTSGAPRKAKGGEALSKK